MKKRIENKIVDSVELRHCCLCNEYLPLDRFGKNKAAKNGSGLNYACRKCANARRKKYYHDHNEYRNESIQKRIQEFRDRKIVGIHYKGSKCSHCNLEYKEGINESTFDFHHRDPNEKDYDFAGAKSLSVENLLIELDKCDLLCANCHRIHHSKNPVPRGKGK